MKWTKDNIIQAVNKHVKFKNGAILLVKQEAVPYWRVGNKIGNLKETLSLLNDGDAEIVEKEVGK